MKSNQEIGREIGRSCVGEPISWTDDFAASVGAAARKAVGEPPRMQIQGMSVEEIHNTLIGDQWEDAHTIHRLANTPAEPEPDKDAFVKEVWVTWETARLKRLHAGEPPDPIPFEQAYPWEQEACRAIARFLEKH